MNSSDYEQVLAASGSQVCIRCLGRHALRITHADANGAIPSDRPWLKDVLCGAEQDAVPLAECDLLASFEQGCVQVVARSGSCVLREAGAPRTARLGGFEFELQIDPDETFYGWGEWFNAFQRKQGSIQLHIREAISITQGKQTYSAFPFFISSKGYAFFLLNSHQSRWTINSERGKLRIKVDGPPLDYIVIHAPTLKQNLQVYTSLTGRPPLPPRWAFGLWVTSYPQGSQEGVLEHVRAHRERRIPLDAVILDYHWEERFHNFCWRQELIPDPDGLIADLRALGMRLGLIFTPFLNRRNQPLKKIGLQMLVKDIPKGMLFSDERALPEFEEAERNGFLAHPDAAWWFGRGGMFDFSSPQAAAWWQERMKALYVQGVDFFKNDDGEYLPEDAHSALGINGQEYHNLYGFYYGKAIFEGMQTLDERRGLIYARSVWAGSQRYPGLFLGDQKPTFECMRRTLRAGLNLGLAGFAYWTADVFGLDGKTDEETHMRYAQWALLNPIARYFWRPPAVDATRFPWSHGARAEENFRRYTNLRYRLLPYFYALAWQAWQTGLPIVRPLLLEFEADTRFADVYDQYMLGSDLLVAPVVTRGARSRHILLPQGEWYDFWSEQCWQGPGEIEISAPLEHLPLLVRGGAILPLGPVVQFIGNAHVFDTLELHVYPPFPSCCEIFDDDGSTRAYQQGELRRTLITVETRPDGLLLQIQPFSSAYSSNMQERRLHLVFHRAEQPAALHADGAKLLDWSYNGESCVLRADLSVPVDAPVSLKIISR